MNFYLFNVVNFSPNYGNSSFKKKRIFLKKVEFLFSKKIISLEKNR